jgi:predicted metalloprotease
VKWDKGQSSDLVEDRRRRKRESSDPPGPTPRRRRPSSDPPTPRPRVRRRKGGKSIAKSGAAAGVGLVAAAIAVVVGVVKGGGDEPATAEPAEPTERAEVETTEAEVAESSTSTASPERSDGTVVDDAEIVEFLTILVNDTNDFWKKTFEGEHRLRYKPARLVIFDRLTRSKCGPRLARGGPIYCPNDQTMYVPPSFFAELREQHDAPGDFAQALVIAHEMGHHAQLGLGITKVVHHKKKEERSKTAALRWKRQQELQADCLAGVWAADIEKRGRLEAGDTNEAVTAVASIGDDALQKAAGKKVDRKTWGHGSSAQRVRYFKKGFRRGALKDCLRELGSPYIK